MHATKASNSAAPALEDAWVSNPDNLQWIEVLRASFSIWCAGVIEDCPERRMASQTALEHRQMPRRHERIECQIVLEECVERRVERCVFQPQRIIDVLDHGAQAFELPAALSNEAANAILHIIRCKIYPPDDAGNRRVSAGETEEETRFRLGGGSLHQH